MSKPKLLICLLSICLVLALFCPTVLAQENQEPTLSAQSAILIEAESGQIICQKNADDKLPMASTTKIMTALVALELSSPETVITVHADAVGVEGSSVYLTEGEQLTLEQLLYAMMLESANDAAAAIAIGISGSIESFADEMNRKAKELGLSQTHFTNPHGLDHEEHYTTAYELSVITRSALQNELFGQIVATRKTTIPHAADNCTRLLVNHNKLLRLYDGCVGVKTGFTKQSGRCLVSAAERNGVKLIAVTLNSPDDWNDHTKLFDFGFTQFKSVSLCQPEDITLSLPVVGGVSNSVMAVNTEELSVTLPVGHGVITYVLETQHFEYAPLQAGQCLGKVIFYCDTNGDGIQEVIAETALVSCNAIEKQPVKRSFWQWLCSLFGF